ncbi:molybdopterin molybdotransferase MoeA [Asticcacaulis solisilvae]|uniref:molybdopterin molybdotransferase MoeA n=1 Tax=Asticcacaulis solisilvae TaxID=1217274 RepID=UPI003FD739CE
MDARKNVAVAEAIDIVRAACLISESREVPLKKAHGRVLAETILATRDQPPFSASAMDGYAIRREGLDLESLTVIGESAAGRRFKGEVRVAEAVRIFTGAPVPDGCDVVVIQENVGRDGDTIRLLPDAKKGGDNIRPAGQDFGAGDVLLEAGLRLDAWRLSLVAASGRDHVHVARRPRIALLCTGDELVPPGDKPSSDQIFESASFALMALIQQWGGKAHALGVEGDSEKAIVKALKDADADIVVTVGGASVGDHDLVKPALSKLGLALDFQSLSLRPGKPTAFGRLDDGRRTLSLPGNPASAFVVAQLLMKPWIEASLGMPATSPFVKAKLTAPAPPAGPRETYLRARTSVSQSGQFEVTPFGQQDSSLVGVFARADALVRLPAGAQAMAAGDMVDILPLDRL